MQIFNNEIKDGLEDQLNKCTASFNCLLERTEKPSENTIKSTAAFGEGRNFDLYYLQSILASVGPNKNDDVFLPEEIWAARHTPVHKQLNYMHNEKDIIGVITDSIVLGSDGSVLDESRISDIKDIATQAVIWTQWDDKIAETKIKKIIASIEDKKLFVSMEALFKKFDYMLVEGGVAKIVPRTEQTSFLTKYLRSFGGTGVFENARIYRVLRDFTFSGKGIVEDPANPRSIIDNHLFVNKREILEFAEAESNNQTSSNKLLSTVAENIMEETLAKEVAELKVALAKANETIESMKAAETKKATAEVEDLRGQIEAMKTLAAETKAKMDEMEKDCAEKMDKMEKDCAAKVEDTEAKLAEANQKLADITAEKVVAERCSKLIAVNVEEAKAKEIVKTFASLSDDLFAQIVPLYENKATASNTSTQTDVDDAIEKAKASKVVSGKVENVDEEKDEIAELSKSIASKLNLSK